MKSVTRSRSMISSALSGSKRGSIESVAPARIPAFSEHVCPNEWNSGSEPRITSSPVIANSSCATCALRPRLPCVSSAPFGVPVVPEV